MRYALSPIPYLKWVANNGVDIAATDKDGISRYFVVHKMNFRANE